MGTTNTVIEIVKFKADGLTEIAAKTKALRDEVKQTNTTFGITTRLLADPAYQKHVQLMDAFAKKTELATLRQRNLNAARGLADGSTVRQMRSVERLNKQYERTRREAEMIAKYGERTGRFLNAHGGKITALTGLAGGAAAMGLGLARQGFQGTVEGAQHEYEMKLLSRQFASVMKPVMDLMTRGARTIREKMEGTSGAGQNAMMAGMLIGGAGAGLVALRSAGQMIGAVAGEAMVGRLRGGLLRAGVGLAGAGVLAYGVSEGNVMAGAAGGAMLGFSVGGPVGAAVGGVAGGAAAKAQTIPNARPGERPSEYYARMRREEGRSMVGAAAYMGMESISESYYGIMGRGKDRRDVSLSAGGFDEPGTGYDRINSAIERTKPEDDAKAFTREMGEWLARIARATEAAAVAAEGRPLERVGGGR